VYVVQDKKTKKLFAAKKFQNGKLDWYSSAKQACMNEVIIMNRLS